jgi:hypothetical protein
MFVIDDTQHPATGDEMVAIDAFNDQLRAEHHWVMAAGIARPESAHVIDNRAGRGQQRPGSLFAGTEHYSGFWIIAAESTEQALALAARGSQACNRRVELRPFLR